MNLADINLSKINDINLSKIKPSSKTKTTKGAQQQPVTSSTHPSQRTTTTTSRTNEGLIECTSLDFYMTDRTHQTAACSSTEKQVLHLMVMILINLTIILIIIIIIIPHLFWRCVSPWRQSELHQALQNRDQFRARILLYESHQEPKLREISRLDCLKGLKSSLSPRRNTMRRKKRKNHDDDIMMKTISIFRSLGDIKSFRSLGKRCQHRNVWHEKNKHHKILARKSQKNIWLFCLSGWKYLKKNWKRTRTDNLTHVALKYSSLLRPRCDTSLQQQNQRWNH